MAIRAGSAQELLCGSVGRYVLTGVEVGRMISLAMALLAEERHAHFQHARLIGAMGIMAVRTVFTHGLMLPQERAALLRVALVADLVDRVFGQLMRAGGAMRIVAVGTDDLAIPDGMVRALVDSGPLVLVTLVWVILSRTGSSMAMTSWQLTQVFPALAWMLVLQFSCSPSLWHCWQMAAFCSPVNLPTLKETTNGGLRRGDCRCLLMGPWQDSQLSAGSSLPMRLMLNFSMYSWWHSTHFLLLLTNVAPCSSGLRATQSSTVISPWSSAAAPTPMWNNKPRVASSCSFRILSFMVIPLVQSFFAVISAAVDNPMDNGKET
jgi:hypothetical protein